MLHIDDKTGGTMGKVNYWGADEVEFLHENCFKGRYTEAEKKVIDVIRSLENPLVLDVGCGTGRFLDILEKEIPSVDWTKNYTGVDTSSDMICKAMLTHLDHDRFIYLEEPTDEFELQKPDVIVAFDVLQHQQDPIGFIEGLLYYEADYLFIETWYSKNGQELTKTNNIIELHATKSKFYENIYNENALSEICEMFDFEKPLIFKGKPEMALFIKYPIKDLIIPQEQVEKKLDIPELQLPKIPEEITDPREIINILQKVDLLK